MEHLDLSKHTIADVLNQHVDLICLLTIDLVFVLIKGSNDLTGSIPSVIGLLSGMEHLELRHNQLTGPIPSEFGLLTPLTHLSLSM